MDFKEWLREHEREVFKNNQACFDKAYVFGAKQGFKAGQQSKQAEIDGLEKKLKYEKLAYKNIKLQFLNKQHDLDELQVEIDELKAKLEEVENHAFMNYDYERDDDHHSYWSGYNVAMGEFLGIIKGDQK